MELRAHTVRGTEPRPGPGFAHYVGKPGLEAFAARLRLILSAGLA